MIVTPYQNETLYNKVFFDTVFMIFNKLNADLVLLYDTLHSDVLYFTIVHAVRYSFIYFNVQLYM